MKNKVSNIILIIILIIVIVLGVMAYKRYDSVMKEQKAEQEAESSDTEALTGYTYGGVDKIGYTTYTDTVNQLIKNYNNGDGEALAAMIDFAAADVYERKGEENFDEYLYSMITDVETYVAGEEYYLNSLSIMCAMLLQGEEEFIAQTEEYDVTMELEELSELSNVADSRFLYEATAKIKTVDNNKKETYDTVTKIRFVTYDDGDIWYVLNLENVVEADE